MAIANRDQSEHWNASDDVKHWVTAQARYDGMLAPFIEILLDAAGLAATDRILDVGCGCGATTLAAARVAADGHAHGVDLSAPMLDRAREDARHGGLSNATFEQADAQVHPFDAAAFDAVLSRFGIMFFADPVTAFANMHRATRAGGRLAFVCWQPRPANEWMSVPIDALAKHVPLPEPPAPGAVGMFAFADPERPRQVLADAGWCDILVTPHTPTMLLGGPGTIEDAVDFVRNGSMGRTMLTGVDPETQARSLDEVRNALTPFAGTDGVRMSAAVWLVTASA